MYVPAVDNNGATEEILESIDTSPQFQEEMWLPWDTVVWPAYELDVSHLPLRVLLPLLQTQTHTDNNVNKKKIEEKSHLLVFSKVALLTWKWTRWLSLLHTITHLDTCKERFCVWPEGINPFTLFYF